MTSVVSRLQHIAMAVFMGRWKGSHLAAFTAYFDGSGCASDPNSPVLAVAGFIADVDEWIEFEHYWKKVCSDFGVSALHMKEFAHSKGEFVSWKGDQPKRNLFMSRLVNVIRHNVRNSFAALVVLKDYVEMEEKYQGVDMRAYSLAACTCVNKVKRWAKRQKVDESTIAYVFEDGDEDQDNFKKLAKLYCQVTPIPLPKAQSVAFQAADLLAYEYLKANKKIYEFPPGTFADTDLRMCIQELMKIPNGKNSDDWGIHDRASFARERPQNEDDTAITFGVGVGKV
jgi:hypothetical protein